MMNLGVVLPEEGYLEAVRQITRDAGVVLIFDEVKTGLCIAAGGAVERFGVVPDMVTMAKSLGGGLPTGAIGVAGKGCVTFSPTKIVDYATFKANQDKDLSELAWLFNMNRGIFMTPGREEEWTLSVTHDDAAVDAYVQVFEAMADELTR